LSVEGNSDFNGNITITSAGNLTIYNAAATPVQVFTVDGTTGDGYFAGDVGIGTASPTAKLDVNGNVNITGKLTVSGAIDRRGLL
jgi:hypothetical protein